MSNIESCSRAGGGATPARPILQRNCLVALAAAAIVIMPSTMQPQGASLGEQTLRPGDAIRLQVWRMPEFTGDFAIDADGRILHPRFDTVRVAGVVLSVVESRIRQVLDREQAGVQFVFQPLFNVGIEGEVERPTVERVPLGTTVGQAIAAAGGLTDFARFDRVRLVRAGTVTTLDLRSPTSAGLALPLRSGDRIIVDRRGRRVSEYFVPIVSVLGTAASIANLILRD